MSGTPRKVVGSYEALPPERLHRWLDGLLPAVPALVLDVGAGTGRDAAWFAGLGHDVVAAANGTGTDRGMVGSSASDGRDIAAALYRGSAGEPAGLSGETTLPAHPNAVFAAISLQRLRLRHDQQMPEWGGVFADDKTRT
jgi:SAM-dependent methyltransferase